VEPPSLLATTWRLAGQAPVRGPRE